MEKVYTVRMQEIIHYIAYELEAPDAVLHLLGFKIFLKIINTHLLTVEGAFRLVSQYAVSAHFTGFAACSIICLDSSKVFILWENGVVNGVLDG